ncbi:MAG: membrane protein insertase YidC [Acetobacteraceae bacterium]
MDQTRLFVAIAASIAILIVFQFLMPPKPALHPTKPAHQVEATVNAAKPAPLPAAPGEALAAVRPLKNMPRLEILAPAVKGSIDLQGARLDHVVLRDYHKTVSRTSPNVPVLGSVGGPRPYYVQFGWAQASDEQAKVPDNNTLWKASRGPLSPDHPVTLSWDNGQGQVFHLVFSVDDHYMFHVVQEVTNDANSPIKLYPWERVRRGYTPETKGSFEINVGPLGVLNGSLHQLSYEGTRNRAKQHPDGVALHSEGDGGWAGITDKYWLVALVPNQHEKAIARFQYLPQDGHDHYQVDFIAAAPEEIQPGKSVSTASHVFVGAKELNLLRAYQRDLHIPYFEKAVDFGILYIITKPTFYALDWLNALLGNFGLAIMAFTVCLRAIFFPLANKSYKSMSRMRLLQPKMQAIKAQFKDDTQRQQKETMALYKSEGVNPVSGCLPMLIQVPVFWALYKVLFVTIEMRHAPFFGWIRDLSAQDPTNVFNLFGLIPFDPTTISPMLQIGAWPLVMGVTMFLQQRLNPSPPDPMQQKVFLLMPVVFTVMMAHFPVGLVIYYSWNNLLSVSQQWLIMRRTTLAKPKLARPSSQT